MRFQRLTHRSSDQARRRGATSAEMALVIMVFLTLVFGMLELAIAIFQYHVVSQTARHGARLAIVRGEMAQPLGEWDPSVLGNPYTATLSDNAAIPNAVRQYSSGIDPQQSTVRVAWPDGNHELESPVQVRVTTVHQPFVTFLFTSNWTFVGQSTMPIAH